MSEALALKYRPQRFEDLCEQGAVRDILVNQINTNTIKNGYLFTGPAGCGKTTSARIFANMINKGEGEPIELDAASNNSVEDIRRINEQAVNKPLVGEYKVFVIDECFPANTLVSTEAGYVRIKDVEPGMKVKSMTGMQTVTHSFKNSVLTEHLCCVTLNSSKKIVTTQDHLFFTNNGWVKAKDLINGDILYGTADLQKLWETFQREDRTELYSEVLLPRMFGEIQGKDSQAENENIILSNLWKGNDCSELFQEKNMFCYMQGQNDIQVRKTDYEYRIWDDVTETIIRKDVEVKSFSQSRNNSESENYEREEWDTSCLEGRTGWQREVHHTTNSLVRSIREWMGIGISDTNRVQSKTGKRNVSYVLQSRPRLSRNETCDRSGWCRPQIEKQLIERCEESGFVRNIRVESVEVYKRGYNDELFLDSFTSEQLSANYVDMYDLEVKNDHCYFVEDVLVHNCHMLSNSAWNAFLKTLEEPPKHAIFILCTTNPEKIPATILSRVQRYNFQKISTEGIIRRLHDIMCMEREECLNKDFSYVFHDDAIEYIAKLSEGGMRDAITLLDKCLSYSIELTVENVVKALGVADYDTMFNLNNAFFDNDKSQIISIVDDIYSSGVDLKHFIKTYFDFILDINVWAITKDEKQVKLPSNYISELKNYGNYEYDICYKLMGFLVQLQHGIKYEHSPKPVIVAKFLLFGETNDRSE